LVKENNNGKKRKIKIKVKDLEGNVLSGVKVYLW
jgi:protocatechuate 3,4-dioxygenase beta subunit